MSNKIYNLIITILLTTIAVMSWKIYELKESSAKLEQFSVETGVDCIKNSKTINKREICFKIIHKSNLQKFQKKNK